MGIAWSKLFKNRGQHGRNPKPIDYLIMHYGWLANDLLFEDVVSLRECMGYKNLGETLRTVVKFSPCQISKCKCTIGIFTGDTCNNFGWKNSNCNRPGCNHPQSDHVMNVLNTSHMELSKFLKILFDMKNLKGTLEYESLKPMSERYIELEEVFESIYNVLSKYIINNLFTEPNFDTIYGSPPFENTNIDQILLNFCMHIFNDDILELKISLIITKFVLRYFDTWIWTNPKQNLNYDLSEFSNSYEYYYRRYVLYCGLPRCIHSISLRHSPSKIFGHDVLKYTLKEFRSKLQVWCYKNSVMWTEQTKLFCINYFPKYMDLLEKEVYKDNSPIWNKHYTVFDIRTIISSHQE